tara:strand:+ start:1766 stop:1930 length:165 start_codon:yes stop_codon:yes gene_type:complete
MEKELDTELVTDIAQDRLMSDLCLKWYLEQNEEIKKKIYIEEILTLYKKINKIE